MVSSVVYNTRFALTFVETVGSTEAQYQSRTISANATDARRARSMVRFEYPATTEPLSLTEVNA